MISSYQVFHKLKIKIKEVVFCFNKYSKIGINVLSFIICCLICFSFFSITNLISSKINSIPNQPNPNIPEENYKNNYIEEIKNLDTENKKIQYEWYLEIPSIDLYAEISEGTDAETLNRFIGHFEESKKESGNVCLAAHNRGYDVNYFARLKELEKGDEVFYFVNENEYKYIIDEIIVIYETDWTVIENTEEDRITLITCIENRDKYRLCVRGIREE